MTPWTVAHQPPLSMGFSREEYWNGLPFPSPEDLPKPGIKPGSPALQAASLLSGPVVKNPPVNAGDMGSIPGPEDSTCLGATKPVCHNY